MEQCFHPWFSHLQTLLTKQKHRSLVLLKGECSWAIKQLQTIGYLTDDGQAANDNITVFSNHEKITPNVSRQTYRRLLGTECQGIVFWGSQLDIDALAALSGTVKPGGIMVVVMTNEQPPSLFVERFMLQLLSSKNNYLVKQGLSLPGLPKIQQNQLDAVEVASLNSDLLTDKIAGNLANNAGQAQAVALIHKVFKGHRDRPLVLTADRGRGKSTALAIACSEILKHAEQYTRIVITAPNLAAVTVFFNHLKQQFSSAQLSSSKLVLPQGEVEFIAIDQLLANENHAALVLIDEAAGIPVYLLAQLVQKFHRTVFSSTVHGYEGAGRGFTIKFAQILQELKPQWRQFKLTEPIRWANDDPLEQFIFASCLLNAELTKQSLPETASNEAEAVNQTLENRLNLTGRKVEFKRVTAQELLADEDLLQQIFAILVTAHYQTSPSDLKQILDNEQVKISLLLTEGSVIAVAMMMTEGGSCEDEIQAIKNNQRRLKNQFLPQSLLSHCGIEKAFEFKYLRIMRIAVHPQWQTQGVGRYFLNEINQYASEKKFDFVGSSFGANHRLLRFWQQSDFKIARIGFSQDKASGENSALVLNALNSRSMPLLEHINALFYRQFDYLLSDEYQHLSQKLVWQILHHTPVHYRQALTAFDHQTIGDFIGKHRLYSACVFSLHQWLLHHCLADYSDDVRLLIARVLQKRKGAALCQKFQLSGKKALNQHLVDYVKAHYQDEL